MFPSIRNSSIFCVDSSVLFPTPKLSLFHIAHRFMAIYLLLWFFFLIIFLLLRVSRALHSIFFSLLLVWWFGWMWKPHHHLQDEFLWVMWSKSHSLPYFLWEKEVSIKLKLLSRWRSLQYCPWSSTLLMFCMFHSYS